MSKHAWIPWLVAPTMFVLAIVHAVEIRTPYYEAPGGIWFDFRGERFHGLCTLGLRKQFRGAWSLQVEWYRGPHIEHTEQGIYYGTIQHDGHPRMWWFSVRPI
jgi:hypothetical protein